MGNEKEFEFKGTPGPWIAVEDIDSLHEQRIMMIHGKEHGIDAIASVWSGRISNMDAWTRADGILISKAPELLEMLKEIVDEYAFEKPGFHHPTIERARELLTQATKLP